MKITQNNKLIDITIKLSLKYTIFLYYIQCIHNLCICLTTMFKYYP